MNDRIKELQNLIKQEEFKMAKCSHIYNEPFYNPDTKYEPSGYRTVAQGSDIWSEVTSYQEVKIDRWTRVCKNCGYQQHTNKKEPVITGYKPSF